MTKKSKELAKHEKILGLQKFK